MAEITIGQVVSVRIGPLAQIAATIIWIEGENSGIKFERPLDEAVIGHITSFARPHR